MSMSSLEGDDDDDNEDDDAAPPPPASAAAAMDASYQTTAESRTTPIHNTSSRRDKHPTSCGRISRIL